MDYLDYYFGETSARPPASAVAGWQTDLPAGFMDRWRQTLRRYRLSKQYSLAFFLVKDKSRNLLCSTFYADGPLVLLATELPESFRLPSEDFRSASISWEVLDAWLSAVKDEPVSWTLDGQGWRWEAKSAAVQLHPGLGTTPALQPAPATIRVDLTAEVPRWRQFFRGLAGTGDTVHALVVCVPEKDLRTWWQVCTTPYMCWCWPLPQESVETGDLKDNPIIYLADASGGLLRLLLGKSSKLTLGWGPNRMLSWTFEEGVTGWTDSVLTRLGLESLTTTVFSPLRSAPFSMVLLSVPHDHPVHDLLSRHVPAKTKRSRNTQVAVLTHSGSGYRLFLKKHPDQAVVVESATPERNTPKRIAVDASLLLRLLQDAGKYAKSRLVLGLNKHSLFVFPDQILDLQLSSPPCLGDFQALPFFGLAAPVADDGD